MEVLAQQLINWLVFGSIYTLIAIGFTLLFGVINIVHFSHGDVSILAAFLTLLFFGLAPALVPGIDATAALLFAVIAGILLTGVIGLGLERGLIRPFRRAPPLMVLVSTVALGMVIRELIRLFYPQGSNPQAFPTLLGQPVLSLPGLQVSGYTLLVAAVTAALLLGLFLFLKHSEAGLRIRAVAQDLEAAMMMGVKVDRVMAGTFFIASAIGALAGLLFASYVGILRFDFGLIIGLKGFSAAVVGGLGSIYGAVIGGFLLAGVEIFAMAAVPGGTAYKEVFSFLLVILFLVFRPSGILGTPVHEKV